MTMAVGYPVVATAVLIYLTFFSSSRQNDSTQVKTSRRLGDKHLPFDPIVRQWEKLTEVGESPRKENSGFSFSAPPDWDSNLFSAVFEDPEEYFSEEGQIDIVGRLQVLFPLLDRSPKDETITLQELEAWNVWQAYEHLIYRTRKAMEQYDKNGDQAISLAEYLPKFFGKNKESIDQSQAEWWKEKFAIADLDSNGKLNSTELKEFLHPEDSKIEKIQSWFIKDKMRGLDRDRDGKLNFVEFRDQAYNTYKKHFELENGETDAPSAIQKFTELDTNKDRSLTEEEFIPLLPYLHPGEITYARFYTKHLVHQADDNKDGRLTLNEMLDHRHIFYDTVLKERDIDDDDYDEDEDFFHDEF